MAESNHLPCSWNRIKTFQVCKRQTWKEWTPGWVPPLRARKTYLIVIQNFCSRKVGSDSLTIGKRTENWISFSFHLRWVLSLSKLGSTLPSFSVKSTSDASAYISEVCPSHCEHAIITLLDTERSNSHPVSRNSEMDLQLERKAGSSERIWRKSSWLGIRGILYA